MFVATNCFLDLELQTSLARCITLRGNSTQAV